MRIRLRLGPVDAIATPVNPWLARAGFWLLVIGILSFWQWNAEDTILSGLQSSPEAVAKEFIRLLAYADSFSGERSLFVNVLASLSLTSVGYILGNMIGFPIGVALVLRPTVERIVAPIITFVFSLSNIATWYFFIVWFGSEDWVKMLFLAKSACLYQIIITFNGMKGIVSDPGHKYRPQVEDALGKGQSWPGLYRTLLLKFAREPMFLALRLTAARTWTLVVLLEMSGSAAGLGISFFDAYDVFNIPSMLVYWLTLAACGRAVWVLVSITERRVLRYKRRSSF